MNLVEKRSLIRTAKKSGRIPADHISGLGIATLDNEGADALISEHGLTLGAPSETAGRVRVISYKVQEPGAGAKIRVDTPELGAAYWHNHVTGADWYESHREHIVTLLLSTRYNIIGHHLSGVGSINECVADMRSIFAPVICASAFAFIFVHNHPSGDTTPSQADRKLTRRAQEAATLLHVSLVDHVIVGPSKDDEYFSFREMGLL